MSGPKDAGTEALRLALGGTHTYEEAQILRDRLRRQGYDVKRDEGYCLEGEACVCGGDSPRVRACCANWRKPAHGGAG